MNNKVIDGQNISLADAIGLGFKRIDDQQFELEQNGKKFVLSNLTGSVREISTLEEGVEAGNSANGEQQGLVAKNQKQANKDQRRESNDTEDNIQLAGDPIEEKDLDEENQNQTKALEQNGFHVIGDDGYQSGNGKNNNVNKNSGGSVTGPSTIKGNLETGHLELERNKKSKKS